MKTQILPFLSLILVIFSKGCVEKSSHLSLLEGSFFNIDTVSNRLGPEMKERIHEWSGSGWRGERISCQMLLELNGSSFDTFSQKGIMFYFLKKNIEAIECFNKAAKLSLDVNFEILEKPLKKVDDSRGNH